jgi:anti-sigma-K factor RskA
MKLHLHPELLERLAASYALGTLRGPARRRFESMAREHAVVRVAALVWQSRLASMNELQTSSQPPPAVWTRIDNVLQAQREQAAMEGARASAQPATQPGWSSWLRSLTVWRATTAAGVVATVVAVTAGVGLREKLGAEIAQLQTRLQETPQIEYVAVLADDKAAPSMLVTFDPKNHKLTLQRVGAYKEADDRSLQLWALSPSGGPKSLGVLGQDKLLRLTASDGDVREVPALAISLEPKGGVPSATGPTGPVLFKGALIQKLL